MYSNNYFDESSKTNAQRYVFNGIDSSPMFHKEDLCLPELNDGEVLVRVRTATVCLSDIHTVYGARIEPTPRYVSILKLV